MAFVAAVACAVACASAARVAPTAVVDPVSTPYDAATASDAAVAVDAAPRTNPEVAWLTAHLADTPDPSHVGESDAVRRLATMGSEGILAVAEVFRVGDARRVPFARRVLERVALRRCHYDAARAALTIRRIEYADPQATVAADAGIAWRERDQWPEAHVETLRQWALSGAACAQVGTMPATR
jgi:hypothetical protein